MDIDIDNFTWGEVVSVHKVGVYEIVEFKPEVFKGGRGTGKHHDYSHFHPYVNGRDISHSYPTMEQALIGAICYKYDGCNSDISRMVSRMLRQFKFEFINDDGEYINEPCSRAASAKGP